MSGKNPLFKYTKAALVVSTIPFACALDCFQLKYSQEFYDGIMKPQKPASDVFEECLNVLIGLIILPPAFILSFFIGAPIEIAAGIALLLCSIPLAISSLTLAAGIALCESLMYLFDCCTAPDETNDDYSINSMSF